MLPTTVLVNILGCLRRRDLDVLDLVDRAFAAVIATHENHLPRRSLSLTFFNEGGVSLVSYKDTMKHVQVVELPPYLSHSVITKMLFKSVGARSWTEEMYQALLQCRSHFAAGVLCDFRSLTVFPRDILDRSFTEMFTCSTLVFSHADYALDMAELRRNEGDELATLPCIANCANLQIAHYEEAFFDANGAFEWLLGTHAASADVKHLSIGEIREKYRDVFARALIVAIEQQFIHAITTASFTVELRRSVELSPGPYVGTTRKLENTVTNEQLEVVVAVDASKWKVTIERKPKA
ncbi:hypothetical protein AAVH_28406 [Aphelenchoides avenae]|nr:hypothetical protein AAVH_28406 [Aphelenchus avenae]